MASTSPARIDDDLYASAKLAGEVQSRSASQQVAHWARIGRELESSSAISTRDIAEVLAGSRSYDDLGPREQALVRSEWGARMDERRAALNLAEQFAAEGRTWVELDDDGEVVSRSTPGPAARAPATRARQAPAASRKAAKKRSAPTRKATARSHD